MKRKSAEKPKKPTKPKVDVATILFNGLVDLAIGLILLLIGSKL